MLVVIAVVGIIAAIALPNVGSLHGSATEAAALRNAQCLALIYNAAQTAGAAQNHGTTAAAVDAILGAGVTISNTHSAFHGRRFSAGEMTALESEQARFYLRLQDGLLLYTTTKAATLPD